MSNLSDEEKLKLSFELYEIIINEMKKWGEIKESEKKYEITDLIAAALNALIMSFDMLSENAGIKSESYSALNEFAFKKRNKK
jgi:hypothetical protein